MTDIAAHTKRFSQRRVQRATVAAVHVDPNIVAKRNNNVLEGKKVIGNLTLDPKITFTIESGDLIFGMAGSNPYLVDMGNSLGGFATFDGVVVESGDTDDEFNRRCRLLGVSLSAWWGDGASSNKIGLSIYNSGGLSIVNTGKKAFSNGEVACYKLPSVFPDKRKKQYRHIVAQQGGRISMVQKHVPTLHKMTYFRFTNNWPSICANLFESIDVTSDIETLPSESEHLMNRAVFYLNELICVTSLNAIFRSVLSGLCTFNPTVVKGALLLDAVNDVETIPVFVTHLQGSLGLAPSPNHPPDKELIRSILDDVFQNTKPKRERSSEFPIFESELDGIPLDIFGQPVPGAQSLSQHMSRIYTRNRAHFASLYAEMQDGITKTIIGPCINRAAPGNLVDVRLS